MTHYIETNISPEDVDTRKYRRVNQLIHLLDKEIVDSDLYWNKT
jgi:hypothetical protein